MGNNWKKKPLGSLCNGIGDGVHGTPKYVVDSPYCFINGNNLKDGKVDTSSAKRVDGDEYQKHFIELDETTLLMSINGTLGSLALYRGESVILGKSAAYIRCRDISREFCYYYFQLRETQRAFFNIATGSTIKNLSLDSIKNFQVPVPSASEQARIAAVLSALDAKIALNHRINGELEGLAKLLYDYWFVQYDFPLSAAQAAALGKPRLAGQPYRTSGGPMVFHPQLKREIPKGWEVDNILAVADLGGGATPSKKNAEFWKGTIPFFTPTDAKNEPFCLDTEDHITQEGLSNSSTRLYDEGTLFITARGSVGKAMIISREMAMNQSCYALIPREGVGRAFLYFHTMSLMGFLRAKSSGSVFKSIVTNDIKFTPAIVPNSENLKEFSQFAEPVFNQILNNQKQNQELTALRDWLLPMLMNGQVRVGCSESADSRQKGGAK